MKIAVKQSIILIFLTCLCSASLKAQRLGSANVQKMNSLIQSYAAVQMESLSYMENYGIVEQKDIDGLYRFRLQNIATISVAQWENSYSVTYTCSEGACITQLPNEGAGKSIEKMTYFFTDAKVANSFAKYTAEILIKDFRNEPEVNFYKGSNETEVMFVDSKPKVVEKPKKVEEKKEAVLLNRIETKGEPMPADANNFCKALITILNSGNTFKGIQGAPFNGMYQSREQLPMADKNYINAYKGKSAFIAEFGSSKKSEELEDLFFKVQEDIDACLSQDWESDDMRDEEVYEGMRDHIFHIDYYKEKGQHSISLLLMPDTKNYTMFMRIGRR